MFSDLKPVITLAVTDMARARQFYEGTLGLKQISGEEFGTVYQCGDGRLLVYPSEYAGTNKATAAGFACTAAQFDEEIDSLRSHGISFLTFDYEGMTWDGDVAVTEGERSVWFTDPDGNILNISTMSELV